MSKQYYQNLCSAAPDLPLFMQPWYLDAVCGAEHWHVVTLEKGHKTVAAWPFFLKKKWLWSYVAMPPLVRMMGPYVLPEWRDQRQETRIIEALLEKMPRHLAAFEQDFNYTAQNWLPLYWKGFRQTSRYSYTLDLQDMNKVWQNIAPDYRNQKIRKAEALMDVYTGASLIQFLQVHDQSFSRQKITSPITIELLRKIDEPLAHRDQRAIFYCADKKDGAVCAVSYLAWDNTSAYYLLAGESTAHRHTGAGILLAWHCMRFTAEVLQLPRFDFLGSMIPSIERVRRNFGAEQSTYFRVKKEWSLLWRLGKVIFR
jgi:hypothetical protein